MEEKKGIVVVRYDHAGSGAEMLNRYTSEGYFILCANSVWNEKTGRMESEVILGLGRVEVEGVKITTEEDIERQMKGASAALAAFRRHLT